MVRARVRRPGPPTIGRIVVGVQFWCRAVAMQMVEGRCRELRMARVVSAGCFPELGIALQIK